MAKALPAFSSIMRTAQKNDLVSVLYTYPGRLLRVLLEPLEQVCPSLCNKLEILCNQLYEEKKIKKLPDHNEILLAIQNVATGLMLSLLDHIAQCSVDSKTYDLLQAYPINNSIEEIQRLLFIENSGNSTALLEQSLALLKKYEKDHYMTVVVRMIVRKHLLYNNAIPYSVRMRIIDKVFGKHARKDLYLPLKNTN